MRPIWLFSVDKGLHKALWKALENFKRSLNAIGIDFIIDDLSKKGPEYVIMVMADFHTRHNLISIIKKAFKVKANVYKKDIYFISDKG